MPARTTPSKGGKPDKLFRDALMLAVKREFELSDGTKTSKINVIASKLVDRAIDGNEQAAMMIRDSIDGKPAQSVAIGQDPDLGPLQTEVAIRPTLTREEWLQLHSNGDK
jgi:hypothetical protein